MIDKKNVIEINSTLALDFNTHKLCEIAFRTYSPEFNRKSKRSKISLKMRGSSLVFSITSKDITAFRAALNEIISFGKIFEKTVQMI